MRSLLFSLLLFSCLPVSAQQAMIQRKRSPRPVMTDRPIPLVSLGLGMGIDYGGFGCRVTVSPISHVFVFGAGGYNLAGLGYNVGGGVRFAPDRRFSPYVIGMYGYNAVAIIKFTNQGYGYGGTRPDITETFYGPSFGLGSELKGRRNPKNAWNFELLVPIRPAEYGDFKARMKDTYGARIVDYPVTFSVGYHIGF